MTRVLRTALFLACSPALMAQDFSFETVRTMARDRAAVPYVAPADDLADFWKNLTYDQHRDIRFKMEDGLWAADKKPFSIDFFHPGLASAPFTS